MGSFSEFENSFSILYWFNSSTWFNQIYQPEEVEEVKEVVVTEEDKMKDYHTAAKRLDTTRVVCVPPLKPVMFNNVSSCLSIFLYLYYYYFPFKILWLYKNDQDFG